MLDSTVCFTCCIISSGLKDDVGPPWVVGGTVGAGRSGPCGPDDCGAGEIDGACGVGGMDGAWTCCEGCWKGMSC